MKIQKLEARIAAGVCSDADIASFLKAEALKPIIAAEQRYAELLATPDLEPKPEVTDTRTVIVTEAVYDGPDENGEYTVVSPAVTEEETYVVLEAIDYNALRDAEIAQLEADYPHLVEPEQTYHDESVIDDSGNESVVQVADIMPTVKQRRPEIVPDYASHQDVIICAAKSAIQKHIDTAAISCNFDNIHNIGKFTGFQNSHQTVCEAVGVFASECWDVGNAALQSGVWGGLDALIESLPVFEL